MLNLLIIVQKKKLLLTLQHHTNMKHSQKIALRLERLQKETDELNKAAQEGRPTADHCMSSCAPAVRQINPEDDIEW